MEIPTWQIIIPDPVQDLVRFVPVDSQNWRECTKLPTGEDHRFVAPNVYSIAEAQFWPGAKSMCIYHEAQMVGYTLYNLFYGDAKELGLWITRLMIAEPWRHRGYARAAVQQILGEARQERCVEAALSTEPENFKAIRLYESLGFRATGRIEKGEMVYSCHLSA